MTPALEQARAYLRALGEPVTFQTFSDREELKVMRDGKPSDPNALVLHGTLEQHTSTLARLNTCHAGIYVMVNAGDGKGRSAKNVIRVRAVFADFDGVPLPEPWPLRPHIVVPSSPGRYHIYWLVVDVPLEEFSVMQKTLAAHYGSDSSVHDRPRVMRLPGFHHCKGEPFLVDLLEVNDHPHYTRADLLAAWPALAEALTPKRPEPRPDRVPVAPAGAGQARRYALAALQAEHDTVAAALEGQRNDTLNRAAFALGQFVGAGALEHHEVEDALAAAAASCGLPYAETARTIKSGLEAGAKTPRTSSGLGHSSVNRSKGRDQNIMPSLTVFSPSLVTGHSSKGVGAPKLGGKPCL